MAPLGRAPAAMAFGDLFENSARTKHAPFPAHRYGTTPFFFGLRRILSEQLATQILVAQVRDDELRLGHGGQQFTSLSFWEHDVKPTSRAVYAIANVTHIPDTVSK